MIVHWSRKAYASSTYPVPALLVSLSSDWTCSARLRVALFRSNYPVQLRSLVNVCSSSPNYHNIRPPHSAPSKLCSTSLHRLFLHLIFLAPHTPALANFAPIFPAQHSWFTRLCPSLALFSTPVHHWCVFPSLPSTTTLFSRETPPYSSPNTISLYPTLIPITCYAQLRLTLARHAPPHHTLHCSHRIAPSYHTLPNNGLHYPVFPLPAQITYKVFINCLIMMKMCTHM